MKLHNWNIELVFGFPALLLSFSSHLNKLLNPVPKVGGIWWRLYTQSNHNKSNLCTISLVLRHHYYYCSRTMVLRTNGSYQFMDWYLKGRERTEEAYLNIQNTSLANKPSWIFSQPGINFFLKVLQESWVSQVLEMGHNRVLIYPIPFYADSGPLNLALSCTASAHQWCQWKKSTARFESQKKVLLNLLSQVFFYWGKLWVVVLSTDKGQRKSIKEPYLSLKKYRN